MFAAKSFGCCFLVRFAITVFERFTCIVSVEAKIMPACTDKSPHIDIWILGSINGLNEIVNATVIRTTLSRLRSAYGYESVIVDAYGWLHAGKNVTGVVELLSRGHPCPPLYSFFERRICATSLGGKLDVYLCFDGASINKDITEKQRAEDRLNKRDRALELQKDGEWDKSTQLFRESLDITPDIAKKVVDHLHSLSAARKREIGFKRCVISINEADPLLSHLNRQIPKSFVLSRDYDIVPWGVQACVLKVDYYNGIVEFFRRDVFDVSAVVSGTLLQVTQHQLIDTCVLAGCDYVKNLRGVSFVTAAKMIRRHGRLQCMLLLLHTCTHVILTITHHATGSSLQMLVHWRKEKKQDARRNMFWLYAGLSPCFATVGLSTNQPSPSSTSIHAAIKTATVLSTSNLIWTPSQMW